MSNITLFPKKITTTTMGLTASVLDPIAQDSDGYTPVMRVWGIVSGRTPGTTQYGSFTKFTGEIAALNYLTTEEARSQALIVPPQAETIINSLFEKATKTGTTAQIAIEIGVVPNKSAKNGSKYAWAVKPLIEYKAEDALSAMALELPNPPKELSAPKSKK